MSNEYAVIGLGQFGEAVARHLADHGQSVLAVDLDMERVESIKDDVDAAVQADATDEAALSGLHIDNMKCVVVAMGATSTEGSIMTTALLRQLGVPRVIARSANRLHSRILRQVGATDVVDPEAEMGERLARRLARPSIIDQIDLGDAQLAEVETPEAFAGQSLSELDIRSRFHVSVLAIRREGSVRSNPHPDDLLETGDVIVIIGDEEAVSRVASLA
ncbi:MAG: potassium channel family protein [Myxococcota bacterium]